MKRLLICVALVLIVSDFANAVGTWTALDYPDAWHTRATDISGNIVVGTYQMGPYSGGSAYNYGFVYNTITQSWTSLNHPGASMIAGGTEVSGISGSSVVGTYHDSYGYSHGFSYDITTQSWTPLNYPGAIWTTEVYGIDGSNIIGYQAGRSSEGGFLYDGANWTTIVGKNKYMKAISGNNIVAGYDGLYNMTTQSWTPINYPGSYFTDAYGIDGSNIVGKYSYYNSLTHGFLLSSTGWRSLDYPGAMYTSAHGIEGSNIVGAFSFGSGERGFIYTIPEPATLLLLGMGAVVIRKNSGFGFGGEKTPACFHLGRII